MTSAFTKDSVTPEERRYAEAAEDHLPLVKMLCRRFAPLNRERESCINRAAWGS